MKKSAAKKWAEKIASVLSAKEFSKFADFLDNGDLIQFSTEVAAIDCKNCPEKYADVNF